jgi:hypothetical protein
LSDAQAAASVDVGSFVLPTQQLSHSSAWFDDSFSDSLFVNMIDRSSLPVPTIVPRNNNAVAQTIISISPGVTAQAPVGESNQVEVENIGREITEMHLREIFSEVGAVQTAHVRYATNGLSEGSAVITFATSNEAARAAAEFHLVRRCRGYGRMSVKLCADRGVVICGVTVVWVWVRVCYVEEYSMACRRTWTAKKYPSCNWVTAGHRLCAFPSVLALVDVGMFASELSPLPHKRLNHAFAMLASLVCA